MATNGKNGIEFMKLIPFFPRVVVVMIIIIIIILNARVRVYRETMRKVKKKLYIYICIVNQNVYTV
jgi:hypothetical protein